MELKLNIYDKQEIVNTYTAETYDIMFGTVEDLIDIINLDALKSDDNFEIMKVAFDVVVNGMDIIKPLLKDIFVGLTDEELRHTKVKDLAVVLVEVIKFTVAQITKGQNSKN